MTDVVTATVVEVPKRQDMWLVLFDGEKVADRFYSLSLAKDHAGGDGRALIVYIPGTASPPDEPKLPRARYNMTIKVHGHTWADALRHIEDAVHHVADHGETCALCSSEGTIVHIEVDQSMTKEKYEADLAAWAKIHRMKRGLVRNDDQ